MSAWDANDPTFGRPLAAPLEQCAQLLGVDLATLRTVAADVEPYLRSTAPRSGASCDWNAGSGPTPTGGSGAATSAADALRPSAPELLRDVWPSDAR